MDMRALVAKVLTVVAMSATLVGLGVGSASAATSLSTLKSECADAGGSWAADFITNSSGRRVVTGYSCWYTDISGDAYVDSYDRYGNYRGTG